MNIKDFFRTKPIAAIIDEIKEVPDLAEHGSGGLSRSLTLKDLVGFGIAAIIGAGIFSTIGTASANGGPAISLLFIFTAVVCGFSALAYAEFASMIPISGSAYTYAYASFGELMAWIIGWDLLMEYAIGNIAVAISWSDYFTSLLKGMNVHIPLYLTMDYLTAFRGFSGGDTTSEAYQAWVSAPNIGGLHVIMDLPALLITVFITYLVYKGIKESRTASNLMVLLKLVVVILVISVGAFYVNPGNWSPFAPNGIGGVLMGVSSVFFAYIGFDAISTTAEECKNPQRDLPRAMILSLIICTILYVLIALVLTGMVSYKELAVGDPLAYVFEKHHLTKIQGLVAASAVVAMASVLLVFQLGQPRIWMSMSRDGLLPPIFSRIHPKFKTPSFSTIVTGLLVAIPSLFMNLTEVTDLTSIGTLFAFVLVNGGILMLQNRTDLPERKFKITYINGKWIFPLFVLIMGIGIAFYSPSTFSDLTHSRHLKSAKELIASTSPEVQSQIATHINSTQKMSTPIVAQPDSLLNYLSALNMREYDGIIRNAPLDINQKFITGFEGFEHHIPMWIFVLLSIALSVQAFRKNFSLIPLLGLWSCLYLMTQLNTTNWYRFLIWLATGLVIYFIYGYKNSKIGKAQQGFS